MARPSLRHRSHHVRVAPVWRGGGRAQVACQRGREAIWRATSPPVARVRVVQDLVVSRCERSTLCRRANGHQRLRPPHVKVRKLLLVVAKHPRVDCLCRQFARELRHNGARLLHDGDHRRHAEAPCDEGERPPTAPVLALPFRVRRAADRDVVAGRERVEALPAPEMGDVAHVPLVMRAAPRLAVPQVATYCSATRVRQRVAQDAAELARDEVGGCLW
eukprot:6213762-Pleurochrysis_carterae.AAC.7